MHYKYLLSLCAGQTFCGQKKVVWRENQDIFYDMVYIYSQNNQKQPLYDILKCHALKELGKGEEDLRSSSEGRSSNLQYFPASKTA